MEKRELTCIGCPVGCALTVTMEGKEVVKVEGNSCKIGNEYGRKECTAPMRIVTSTVRVADGETAQVSVKTATDIPKGKIMECIYALKDIQVKAPVHIGDVVLKNAAGTGVDIVATKECEALVR